MKTILCYGDSLSWGIVPGSRDRHPFGVRWGNVLAAELEQKVQGNGVRVIEEHLNGRTTVWDEPFRPGRNGRRWLQPALETHAPVDLLILFLGSNDLQTVHGMGAHEAALGCRTLIDIAQARVGDAQPTPPQVLLIAPPPTRADLAGNYPRFFGADQKAVHFAREYAAVADERGVPWFDAGAVIQASAVDGVHLDADAHVALGRALAPVVTRLL